jgi:hypothetical protein
MCTKFSCKGGELKVRVRSKLDATRVHWHETKLETAFSHGCNTSFTMNFLFGFELVITIQQVF